MMLVKGVSLKVTYKHCDDDDDACSGVSPPLWGAGETTLLSLVEPPAGRARRTSGAALAFRPFCRGS